jgi:hypothetical protein
MKFQVIVLVLLEEPPLGADKMKFIFMHFIFQTQTIVAQKNFDPKS